MTLFNAPIRGLVTSPNPFSKAPPGSLAVADNVVFTAPSVLAPTPGFEVSATGEFSSPDDLRALQVAFYPPLRTMAVIGADGFIDIQASDGTTWTSLSDTQAPWGNAPRIQFAVAARNVFWAADHGVYLYSALIEEITVPAGAPPGLQLTGEPNTDASAGNWFEPGTSVAYRYTICRKDAFGVIAEGAPSGRLVLDNSIPIAIGDMTRAASTVTVDTGDTPHALLVGDSVTLAPGEADFAAGDYTVATVPDTTHFTYADAGSAVSNTVAQRFEIFRGAELTLLLPESVDTANIYFLRLYRSRALPAADNPSDELFLTLETGFLPQGTIEAGVVTVLDSTPEDYLELPLYTNANTGNTALAGNYPPPLCEDLAVWQASMWFANVGDIQTLSLALLGVGSPDGLQDGDVLELNAVEYEFSTTPGSAPKVFLETGFDAPVNVRKTAQNLCDVLNTSDSGLYGYYESGEGGMPGRMRITRRGLSETSGFEAFSDRGAAFNPVLSEDNTNYTIASDSARHPAGLRYSKPGEPEAVPVLNSLLVDSDTEAILRILPMTYRLLVFKTNGIYAVSGTPPYTVTKLSEARLIAPGSLALLNQMAYGLFDQGILRISDSGTESISVDIDDAVVPYLSGDLRDAAYSLAQGAGNEAGRQYLLWLPESADDVANTQCLVWSTYGEAGWTRLTQAATCVAISTDGAVVIGDPDAPQLLQRRDTHSSDDFCGPELAVTVVSATGDEVTLADASGVSEGDVILDDDESQWLVLSVEGNVVTTFGEGTFSAGATVVLPAIATAVELNPVTGGDPAVLKAWGQCSILFRENQLYSFEVGFSSEVSPDETLHEITDESWGEFGWGELPWGNPSPRVRRIDPLPLEGAQSCQLSVSLRTRQAQAGYELLGFALTAKTDSGVNRG